MFSHFKVCLVYFVVLFVQGLPSPRIFSPYFGQMGITTISYGKGLIFDSVYRHLFELDISLGQSNQLPSLDCGKFSVSTRSKRSLEDTYIECPDSNFLSSNHTDPISREEEQRWLNMRTVPDCLDIISEQCVLRQLVTPNFTLTWYRRKDQKQNKAYIEKSWEVYPQPRSDSYFKIISYADKTDFNPKLHCLGNPYDSEDVPDELVLYVQRNYRELLEPDSKIQPFENTVEMRDNRSLTVPILKPNDFLSQFTEIADSNISSQSLVVNIRESIRVITSYEEQLKEIVYQPDKAYSDPEFSTRDQRIADVCLVWFRRTKFLDTLRRAYNNQPQVEQLLPFNTSAKIDRLCITTMNRSIYRLAEEDLNIGIKITEYLDHIYKYKLSEIKLMENASSIVRNADKLGDVPELSRTFSQRLAYKDIKVKLGLMDNQRKELQNKLQIVNNTLIETTKKLNETKAQRDALRLQFQATVSEKEQLNNEMSAKIKEYQKILSEHKEEIDQKLIEDNTMLKVRATMFDIDRETIEYLQERITKTTATLSHLKTTLEKTGINFDQQMVDKINMLEDALYRKNNLNKTGNLSIALEKEEERLREIKQLIQSDYQIREKRLAVREKEIEEREKTVEKREIADQEEEQSELKRIHTVCNKINSEFEPLVGFLQNLSQRQYESLNQQLHREKRFLPTLAIGAVGYMFFNQIQLERNQQDMKNSIETAENHIRRLYDHRTKDLRQMLGITKSINNGMNALKKNIESLEKYAQVTKQNFELVENQISTLNKKITIKQHWVVLLADLEVAHRKILNILTRNDYHQSLSAAITKLNNGYLPIEFVSESELNQTILMLKEQDFGDLEFAFGIKTIEAYYQLPLTQFTIIKDKAFIELAMPLVGKKTLNREVSIHKIRTVPTQCPNTDWCSKDFAKELKLKDNIVLMDKNETTVLGTDDLSNWECKGNLGKHLCWKVDSRDYFQTEECIESLIQNNISNKWCKLEDRKLEYAKPVELSQTETYKSYRGDDGKIKGRIEIKGFDSQTSEWLNAEQILGKDNFRREVFEDYKGNVSLAMEDWQRKHDLLQEQIQKSLKTATLENATIGYHTSIFKRNFVARLDYLLWIIIIALLLKTGLGFGHVLVTANLVYNPVAAQNISSTTNSTLQNAFKNINPMQYININNTDEMIEKTMLVAITALVAYLIMRNVYRYVFVQQYTIFGAAKPWRKNKIDGTLEEWWVQVDCVLSEQYWFSEKISLVNMFMPLHVDPKLMLTCFSQQVVLQLRGPSVCSVNDIELLTSDQKMIERKFEINLETAQWSNNQRLTKPSCLNIQLGRVTLRRFTR